MSRGLMFVRWQGTRMGAAVALCSWLLAACGPAPNNPYVESKADQATPTLYTAFTARPKHLDPAQSYTSDEAEFTYQTYEPLFQYHYLKRPYTLQPLTAVDMPQPVYLDAQGHTLPQDAPAERVATSVYTIAIRPGIRFQPHPAFARSSDGQPLYLNLGDTAARYRSPSQFEQQGTRELTANDYVYEIKRLASPRIVSPILGHMGEYIEGLGELAASLKQQDEALKADIQKKTGGAFAPSTDQLPWLDLRPFDLPGAKALDDHTLQLRVKGKYPQFLYWLAMPFFAPIPWEADAFYSQPGLVKNNLTLDWWPVGTGPYMLTENDPNARMVLTRNPNFRGEPYPSEGEPGDAQAGLLKDAGKTMPFIDRVVFTREKEGIPYWNKFLQGYYDSSGISADTFDQVIRASADGASQLTPEMLDKQIRLESSVATSIYYLGFNWLDPVVGPGKSPSEAERARLLRQAIAIAVDWEEFSQIFTNGRAIPAHGPLPPGIFGYQPGPDGLNTQVYDVVEGKPVRKPIEQAMALLEKAGYKNGTDPRTGKPLTLALDTTGGGPGDKARFDWYRKQFAKLNIELEIRATDWNRFQEKIRKGNAQLFFLGWNADYPDPENFMFLLYGPNSRAKTAGENASNYSNGQYDALFERMKTMPNSDERARLIAEMTQLVQHDVPWLFAFVPKQFGLIHHWMGNVKPNDMARNDLKYKTIDVAARAVARKAWNRPQWWPIPLLLLAALVFAWPAWAAWKRRERQMGVRRDLAHLASNAEGVQ
ncbi:ABC transporter substrate-binding protein [Limnobacter humi]|uniref:ABC transporter substrate-binding protein n=2 Tax=Limnobacter humi TaxID=1778671 RepID=A0ABT1WFK2_9BURK|nr:ABC transporter substrate-binding protein [Limnobacter humi]